MKYIFTILTFIFTLSTSSMAIAADENPGGHCNRPKCLGPTDAFGCKLGIRVCAAGVNMIIRDGKAICIREGQDIRTSCPKSDKILKSDSGEVDPDENAG